MQEYAEIPYIISLFIHQTFYNAISQNIPRHNIQIYKIILHTYQRIQQQYNNHPIHLSYIHI